MIVFAAAVSIALGLLYVLTTPPSFTASTTMMIDTKKVQLFQQQSMFSDLPIDASTVESQVEILKSETIALAVIKKLHLADDPEFVGGGGGLIGTLLGAVTGLFASSSEPPSEFVVMRRRGRRISNVNLTIKRVGLTYVIVIGFQALSPERAAEIANAVANAYIDDQLEAKYEFGPARRHLVAGPACRVAGASFSRRTRRRRVQEQERNGRYRRPNDQRAAACRAQQRTRAGPVEDRGGEGETGPRAGGAPEQLAR